MRFFSKQGSLLVTASLLGSFLLVVPLPTSAFIVRPVCPSTTGGVLMPTGATFTDTTGNTWLAPSGSDGAAAVWSSYFFQGPQSTVPAPMLQGWAGVFGTYGGQQGWIVTFYC